MQTSFRGSGEVSTTHLKYQYEYCSLDVNELQQHNSGYHPHQLDSVHPTNNESHCKQDEHYQLRNNYVVFERDQAPTIRTRSEHCELQPVIDQQNILPYDPTGEASHRYSYEPAVVNYHSSYAHHQHQSQFEAQIQSHNSSDPNQASDENPIRPHNSPIVIYQRQQADAGTGNSSCVTSAEVGTTAPTATYYELANFNENHPIQSSDASVGRQLPSQLYETSHNSAETLDYTCQNEHQPNQSQCVQHFVSNPFDPSESSASTLVYHRAISSIEYQNQPIIYNAPVANGYSPHINLVVEDHVQQESEAQPHLLPEQDQVNYQQLESSKLGLHESQGSFLAEHCPDLQSLNCISTTHDDTIKTPTTVVGSSTNAVDCEDIQNQKRCLRSSDATTKTMMSTMIPKTPSSSSSRSSYSESESSMSSTMTRDEKRAREANIPMSWYEIVNLSIEQFNEKLTNFTLTESQMTLIKDIRRRGKNKVAAQSCRKRKMEQIYELQHEVENLADKKKALINEKQQLAREYTGLVQKYDRIQSIIQQHLQQPQVQGPAEQYNCI